MTQPSPTAGAAPWYRGVTSGQRRALIAASLGWMLDAMDFMMYSMVLAYLMKDLAMTTSTAGLLASMGQLAAAAGGILFGTLADRVGRTRALMGSIAVYSVFTAACGFSQTITQLAVLRVLVGLGLGGEWASGAALVSETWPARHRGKALAITQSFWAVGYALAAAVTAVVLPRWGWRAVFFVGAVPALLTLWIRRSVEEPAIWRERRHQPAQGSSRPGVRALFVGPYRKTTNALILMNAAALFAYWGFNTWNPAFLSLPSDQGGIGLSAVTMSGFVIAMQVGTWMGYVTFGFVSDHIGRKRTYVTYLLVAAALLPLYANLRSPTLLLVLGPLIGFFGTGFFAGFGTVVAETFPTAIRATALGVTYNLGRVVSAIAPFTVGSLAQSRGFGVGFAMLSLAFVAAALMWLFIPETVGRELT